MILISYFCSLEPASENEENGFIQGSEEVKKNEVKTEDKPEAVCSEEIGDAFGVPSSAAKTTSSISDEEFDAILKKSNLFEVIKLMKENLPNDPIEVMDPTESISNELIPCLLSSLSQKEKISFKFAQVTYNTRGHEFCFVNFEIASLQSSSNNVPQNFNALIEIF